MANIEKRPDGVWRARYYDAAGRQHARHFRRKVDAKSWIDEVTASVVTGNYVDPKVARTTVSDWCDSWLVGYGTRRKSTVRQAAVHVKVIKAHFGEPLTVGRFRERMRRIRLSEDLLDQIERQVQQRKKSPARAITL